VLQRLTWKECLAYLDDVVVLGRNFEDQIDNLRRVFLRFQKYNLKLKPSKCQLMQTEVKFLRKIVSRNGISVNPDSIDAVKNWPRPTNKKEVESFIGFTNYHRNHIKRFSELAEPLHRLTGTKNEFEWRKDQASAFQSLKEALVHAVVLNYPTTDDVFIFDTDASQNTIGAELSQIQDGVERTICYASKVLASTQTFGNCMLY
jgi:hypothetical protein